VVESELLLEVVDDAPTGAGVEELLEGKKDAPPSLDVAEEDSLLLDGVVMYILLEIVEDELSIDAGEEDSTVLKVTESELVVDSVEDALVDCTAGSIVNDGETLVVDDSKIEEDKSLVLEDAAITSVVDSVEELVDDCKIGSIVTDVERLVVVDSDTVEDDSSVLIVKEAPVVVSVEELVVVRDVESIVAEGEKLVVSSDVVEDSVVVTGSGRAKLCDSVIVEAVGEEVLKNGGRSEDKLVVDVKLLDMTSVVVVRTFSELVVAVLDVVTAESAT
jgi:hypothetical protein